MSRKVNVKGERYLNRRGTNVVLMYTDKLAAEPDMIEISASKARELITRKEEADRARIEKQMTGTTRQKIRDSEAGERKTEPPSAPEGTPAGDAAEGDANSDGSQPAESSPATEDDAAGAMNVDELSDEEVRQEAERLGLKFGKKASIEQIRDGVKAAIGT